MRACSLLDICSDVVNFLQAMREHERAAQELFGRSLGSAGQ